MSIYVFQCLWVFFCRHYHVVSTSLTWTKYSFVIFFLVCVIGHYHNRLVLNKNCFQRLVEFLSLGTCDMWKYVKSKYLTQFHVIIWKFGCLTFWCWEHVMYVMYLRVFYQVRFHLVNKYIFSCGSTTIYIINGISMKRYISN